MVLWCHWEESWILCWRRRWWWGSGPQVIIVLDYHWVSCCGSTGTSPFAGTGICPVIGVPVTWCWVNSRGNAGSQISFSKAWTSVTTAISTTAAAATPQTAWCQEDDDCQSHSQDWQGKWEGGVAQVNQTVLHLNAAYMTSLAPKTSDLYLNSIAVVTSGKMELLKASMVWRIHFQSSDVSRLVSLNLF